MDPNNCHQVDRKNPNICSFMCFNCYFNNKSSRRSSTSDNIGARAYESIFIFSLTVMVNSIHWNGSASTNSGLMDFENEIWEWTVILSCNVKKGKCTSLKKLNQPAATVAKS